MSTDVTCIADMPALLVFEREREEVPADWAIFTAPRPLSGHIEWAGEFMGGVFRAAVDLRAADADGYLRDAIDGKAQALVYVAPELVRPMLISSYRAALADDRLTLKIILESIPGAGDDEARSYLANFADWTYSDATKAVERASAGEGSDHA